ncbi:MAG: hypothetical protein LBE75_06465 [Burkholderiales bacterium]|jgi:hypothetical protein|nr:hypothetical protein [Burkholderiales bacterium]
MTHSIREQIIRAIMAALTPVAEKHGAVCVRRPVDGFREGDEPRVLAVFPESDQPKGEGKSNMAAERTLTVRIVPQVFDETNPDGIADAMLVDVHKTLFEKRGFGGLAQKLRQSDCLWMSEEGIVQVGQIPAAYEIDYRTAEDDLSQKG